MPTVEALASDKHMTPEAIDHVIRKNEDFFKSIKHFTPYDLRRTAANHMTASGIARLVVSKLRLIMLKIVLQPFMTDIAMIKKEVSNLGSWQKLTIQDLTLMDLCMQSFMIDLLL